MKRIRGIAILATKWTPGQPNKDCRPADAPRFTPCTERKISVTRSVSVSDTTLEVLGCVRFGEITDRSRMVFDDSIKIIACAHSIAQLMVDLAEFV